MDEQALRVIEAWGTVGAFIIAAIALLIEVIRRWRAGIYEQARRISTWIGEPSKGVTPSRPSSLFVRNASAEAVYDVIVHASGVDNGRIGILPPDLTVEIAASVERRFSANIEVEALYFKDARGFGWLRLGNSALTRTTGFSAFIGDLARHIVGRKKESK